MKTLLEHIISKALLQSYPDLKDTSMVHITPSKDKQHGDFATNVAMQLAKIVKQPPRKIAETLCSHIQDPCITNMEIAGPGFINFFMNDQLKVSQLDTILKDDPEFFNPNVGKGQKVHLEFVSANPTGPLHVGHGRGAAIGSCMANILTATGHHVHQEYYVNDVGLQMDTLATSLWFRYMNELGHGMSLPEKAYQGDYLIPIAKTTVSKHNQSFVFEPDPTLTSIEEWVHSVKQNLGSSSFENLKNIAYQAILQTIKDDLSNFKVTYNSWFHESTLTEKNILKDTLEQIQATPWVYTKEGALWFKSTEFKDDKDRVLIRQNGAHTYFAADIAYHYYKFNHCPGQIIDIFGSDHHGYVPRVKASMEALNCDLERYSIKLVQFATLFRGQEKISMSTRSGEFITLSELINEVGVDAARYYYCSRKADQHVNFDLELAKKQSNDNPVYYIQYAHARICSILEKTHDNIEAIDLSQLQLPAEHQLIQALSQCPDKIRKCATLLEPHHLTHYLYELAGYIHSYYNQTRIQVEEKPLQKARIGLMIACKKVLAHGLDLLSISAPERM